MKFELVINLQTAHELGICHSADCAVPGGQDHPVRSIHMPALSPHYRLEGRTARNADPVDPEIGTTL